MTSALGTINIIQKKKKNLNPSYNILVYPKETCCANRNSIFEKMYKILHYQPLKFI